MESYCRDRAARARKMIDRGLSADGLLVLRQLQQCAEGSDCAEWRDCHLAVDQIWQSNVAVRPVP